MIRATNLKSLVAKGALLLGNDDFQVWKCKACGAYFLYNAETLHVYLTPDDLKRPLLDGVDKIICLSCKSDLDFEEPTDEEVVSVLASPWGWVMS